MEGLLNTTNLPISPQTTVEDIINFSKSEIQSFLRANHLKISGNKLTLAQRIVDTIQKSKNTTHDQGISSINEDKTVVTLDPQESKVPCITELTAGWSGNDDKFPRISITDIENYLIHTSHRTNDAGKMQCYRQYIRGLNFYKEGYIHKMMINEISPDSPVSYVRSKCYPSMQKGVYEQWVLISKHAPFQILKANCTCPAGNGEGCTHVAGLLFALEGRPITPVEDDDNVPCTSKPCQWNQPSKRKKETRPVKDLTFKRISSEVRSETELRTRGQHENSLWTNARKGRITASYFHDIKSRKDSTKTDTLLSKVFGENSSFDNSALQWGRKQEPIAKKRYKAHKKLKEGKTIKLTDRQWLDCAS
ncbi:uncharacterized protein LOC128557295 [Mercenaria mercenaria]|uniref:uncharacterized protein LOC128557295 n=1 Tax=Mercenaria mercenaria TaxID=6596 RepID=UPI00234F5396|nr:uncharacterized protein LOC128557295 [Mercenaria mercenaria]